MSHADPAGAAAPGAQTPPPLYRCPFVREFPAAAQAPLDPEAPPWSAAPLIHPFRRAEDARPVRLDTRAKLLWSPRALHALFLCEDDYIWGTFTRHNDPIFDEEVVEVFLDPEDRRSFYYEFELSPRDTRFAAEIENDLGHPPRARIARHLDALAMPTRVEIEGALATRPAPAGAAAAPGRWRACMEIPFSLLGGRPAPRPGERWKANLFRIDRGPAGEEYACWSPTLTQPAYFHHPERFGTLEFASAAPTHQRPE